MRSNNKDDLIGRVYEYFLRIYADSIKKEDGEFYTPTCVVQLIAEMIEVYDGVVYDPCCGLGGMVVRSMNCMKDLNILLKVYCFAKIELNL